MEPPRTAIYVARAQLALAGVALLVALIGGIFMQLELWAPGARWSQDWYSRMISMHGLVASALGAAVLAGGLGYAAIGTLVGSRMPAPAIGWVGVGLWTIGLIATLVTLLGSSHETGWTFYTPYANEGPPSPPLGKILAPLAFGGAGLAYGLHFAVIVAANTKQPPLRLAIGGALVLITLYASVSEIWTAVFSIVPEPRIGEPATMLAVVIATVALARDRDGSLGPRASRLTAIAIGCGIAWILASWWAFGPWLVFGLGLVGLWIALAVIGGFGRTVVAFTVFGVAPAILMLGLARVVIELPRDGEVFLHDTHYIVGIVHLTGMIALLAALGAAQAFARWRIPSPISAWAGAGITTAGMILHAYGSLTVGAVGMPRRYWDYDPQFTAGHWVAGAGAAITLVGLVLVLISWVIGRRAR